MAGILPFRGLDIFPLQWARRFHQWPLTSLGRLLIFIRMTQYKVTVTVLSTKSSRPDIDAAVRGGDWKQGMDGEGAPEDATLAQAIFWRRIYREILTKEESVLARIRELMAKQSTQARREVELTNVPVVVAQAERFRQRLGYWEARVRELDGRVKRFKAS